MQNLGLAFEAEIGEDVFGGSDAVGDPPRPAHGNGNTPSGPETANSAAPSLAPPPAQNHKMNSRLGRSVADLRTDVRDRLGKTVMRVVDSQLEKLHEARLVELRGRRAVVTHAVIRNGVSVASLHATLRAGIRHELPIAEDNRTVQRRSVAGGGVYFQPIHEAAWDDGRNLDGRVAAHPEPGATVRPCTLGERERSGGDGE